MQQERKRYDHMTFNSNKFYIIRFALIASLTLTLIGCTPGAYRRSADRDVYALLKDRKRETIGYEPQVEADPEHTAVITKRAYAKIPVTPIPPAIASPLEPLQQEIPQGPLGPEMLD